MTRRPIRTFILLLASCGAVGSQQAAAPARRKFAIVIGVSRYEDAGTTGLRYARWDARLFAQHLRTVRGGGIPERNVRLLLDQDATATQIEKAFGWLGANVGRRDQVYIFVSAIGRSTVLSKDGYLLPFDRPAEKNAISLQTIKGWLQNCCAFAEVYLFADVCREQPVFEDLPLIRRLPLDNKINFSIRSLANSGIGSPFGGLLASREKGPSLEVPQKDLPGVMPGNPVERGFGIFSYFLIQAMQAPSSILPAPPSEPGQFVEFLGNYMSTLTKKLDNREQKPASVGKLTAIPVDWQQPGSVVQLDARLRRPPTISALLAFAGPAFAGPEPQDRLLDRFLAAVTDGKLHGADSIEALLGPATAQVPSQSDQDRERFAVALEDAGEQIVARYGSGDQFPDDPRKLTKLDFELAAAIFAGARNLREQQIPPAALPGLRRGVCQAELGEPLAVVNDPAALAFEARRLFGLARAALSTEPASPSQREIQQAARQLRCASTIDPRLPEIRNALGIANLLLARFDPDPYRTLESAAAEFRRTIDLSPNWAYPRHNLALVYTEEGRFGAAEDEMRAAIERTPYYPYLHYNLGLALQRGNKLAAAERAYRDAIVVFEAEIGRYAARGATWTDLPTRAQLAQQVAATLKRNEAEAYNALGSLYLREQRLPDAQLNYELALQKDSGNIPARHNLALVHLRNGQRVRAENLLRLNTAFTPSRLKLAEVLAERGAVAEAKTEYEAVFSKSPGNAEARMGLARLHVSLKEYDAAVRVLTAAGSQPSAAIQEQLGNVYAAEGNRGNACSAYTAALRLGREQFNPASRLGRDSKALRQKLKGCPVGADDSGAAGAAEMQRRHR